MTRLAEAAASIASQPTMMYLRFQRSASTPAGSPAASWAAAIVPSTTPDSAADPVVVSTSSGKAIPALLKPNPDSILLPHRSW